MAVVTVGGKVDLILNLACDISQRILGCISDHESIMGPRRQSGRDVVDGFTAKGS